MSNIRLKHKYYILIAVRWAPGSTHTSRRRLFDICIYIRSIFFLECLLICNMFIGCFLLDVKETSIRCPNHAPSPHTHRPTQAGKPSGLQPPPPIPGEEVSYIGELGGQEVIPRGPEWVMEFGVHLWPEIFLTIYHRRQHHRLDLVPFFKEVEVVNLQCPAPVRSNHLIIEIAYPPCDLERPLPLGE